MWGVVPGGGVWRREGGAPGSVVRAPCLSLALPESGLGCRGNIEALIFLAWVLAPGFPFPEQIPWLGARVSGSAWTAVRLYAPAAFLGLA